METVILILVAGILGFFIGRIVGIKKGRRDLLKEQSSSLPIDSPVNPPRPELTDEEWEEWEEFKKWKSEQ